MSGTGSLRLDSTLRYFMHGTKCCHRRIGAPLELLVMSTAPCCTKKLLCKKYALLKKTSSQQVQPLSLYPNYERFADVPLLLYDLYVLSIMLRYERALHCCMYTFCRECTTPTKLSLPCTTGLARIGHGLTMSQGRILEQSNKGGTRALYFGPWEAERCVSKIFRNFPK